MELLFFIMNQIDKLDQLLKDLSNEKKFSATIIDSAGMARLLADHDYLFGSLRALLNNSQVNSKTIFMVLNHEDVEHAVQIIEKNVGNLDEPNTGVVFTVPVSYVKGIVKKG